MPKNYYLVLGITSDATPDDIKDAYRRLAKEFHPDHYGNNHSPFLAIQEAYAVLSDPVKRQTHDLAMRCRQKKSNTIMGNRLGAGLNKHVEPLVPGQEAPMDFGTASLERSFYSHRPPFDQLFDKIFSNFRSTSHFLVIIDPYRQFDMTAWFKLRKMKIQGLQPPVAKTRIADRQC